MACQSRRLVRCSATQSSPPRKFMPASSTKPSAARWTTCQRHYVARVSASMEKTRRRIPRHKRSPTNRNDQVPSKRWAPGRFNILYWHVQVTLLLKLIYTPHLALGHNGFECCFLTLGRIFVLFEQSFHDATHTGTSAFLHIPVDGLVGA